MFCKNCGNNLPDNATFCGKCGTQVQQVRQTARPNNITRPNNTTRPSSIAVPSLSDGNPLTLYFIGAAVLNILQIIFWFSNCLKATASLFGASYSESFSISMLFEDAKIISVITVIFCIVSIILCILPVIGINAEKRRMMIFSKITTIWISVWLLLALIASALTNSYVRGLGYVIPTFTGILFILSCIASLVLLFMISSKSKEMYYMK